MQKYFDPNVHSLTPNTLYLSAMLFTYELKPLILRYFLLILLAANTSTGSRALAFGLSAPPIHPARMRKNLDILLTIVVTLTLTVAMLWPLDQPPPAPEGSDKLVHFISFAFAALAFPLARTGRIGFSPVFIGASAWRCHSNSSSPASTAAPTSTTGSRISAAWSWASAAGYFIGALAGARLVLP